MLPAIIQQDTLSATNQDLQDIMIPNQTFAKINVQPGAISVQLVTTATVSVVR